MAGAFDQRVALAMPIESGTGGVPIFRGVNAEGAQTLSSACNEQPWLGDAFGAFTSDPTMLPIDRHEVVGLIAPRGAFIMENPHITSLGPKSGSVAALGGAEVYKALGAGDNITYWSDVQDGNHCDIRPEWKTPLQQNIQKFLLGTGNAPGSFHISPLAQGCCSGGPGPLRPSPAARPPRRLRARRRPVPRRARPRARLPVRRRARHQAPRPAVAPQR